MCPLRSEEKKALLDIARRAISLAVTEGQRMEIIEAGGELSVQSGAFVTLRKGGRLRGCIGQLSACEPLADVVAHCAAAAATDDPRFSRLRADELGQTDLEISVLSAIEPAHPNQVEPGVHGLVISRNERRGVLLPQVAREHGWSRERFLEETCRKAGLALNAWQDSETCIEIFTAEVFSESDFYPGGSHYPPAQKGSGYSSSQ